MIHPRALRKLGRTWVSFPPSMVLFLKHWVSTGQALGTQDSLPKGSSWRTGYPSHAWLGMCPRSQLAWKVDTNSHSKPEDSAGLLLPAQKLTCSHPRVRQATVEPVSPTRHTV